MRKTSPVLSLGLTLFTAITVANAQTFSEMSVLPVIREWLLAAVPNTGDPDDEGIKIDWIEKVTKGTWTEKTLSSDAKLKPGDKLGVPADFELRAVKSDTDILDLDLLFEPKADNDHITAYALTYITADGDKTVDVWVGSDDAVAVWLNGKEIHRNAIQRGVTPDQDVMRDVPLKKGQNVLLAKVSEGMVSWGLYVRLSNYEGLKFSSDPSVAGTPAPPSTRMGTQLRLPPGLTPRAGAAVIRSTQSDPSALAQTIQDLDVMARIFDKALGGQIISGVTPFGALRATQAVYLEGYGALFEMNVRYPLVGFAASEEAKQEPESDTLWERTRRELKLKELPGLQPSVVWYGSGESYDSRRIETLLTTILDTLKQAANIRNLKPEDSVSVLVYGTGEATRSYRTRALPDTRTPRPASLSFSAGESVQAFDTEGWMLRTYPTGMPQLASSLTTLAIHAKKSDVEAFSKGTVNLEEFRRRATILAY